MTLRELSVELEKVNMGIQTLRRSDFEIVGDVAFQAALRQHIVTTLGEVREVLDAVVVSFDKVQDIEAIMKARPSLMMRIQKALTGGEEAK